MKKSNKIDGNDRNEFFLDQMVADGVLTPFATPDEALHCTINTKEVSKNYLLSAPSFRVAFKSAYKKYSGEVISDNQFKLMLGNMEVMAFENKIKYMLSSRICKHEGAVIYDLNESRNLCVKINNGECRIVHTPAMLFKRSQLQIDQVEPDFSVNPQSLPQMLKKHLNIRNKKLLDLYSIWLVTCFMPDIQHMHLGALFCNEQFRSLIH